MHLKAISGAYGNWIGSIPFNPFQSGTPKVQLLLSLTNKTDAFYYLTSSALIGPKNPHDIL